MKRNGNQPLAKEDLIKVIEDNLKWQMALSEDLKKQFEQVKDKNDNDSKKLRNTLQRANNDQIQAINNTCSSLIKIHKSNIEKQEDEDTLVEEEKPKIKKGLID